jgi:hypothetical protein
LWLLFRPHIKSLTGYDMEHNRAGLWALALFSGALLVGCSSGSSGGGAAAPVSATVSGTVSAGLVNGAQVCVYAVSGGVRGAQLACGTTNALGVYSIAVTTTGDVLIEATGGSYVDEATGTTRSLSTPMTSVVNVGNGGAVAGMVTPLTQVAFNQMGSSVSAAAFANAAAALANQLGLGSNVNLASTAPTFSPVNSQWATNAYAAWLGALSQYQVNAGNISLAALINGWGTSYQSALQTALTTYNTTLQQAGLGTFPLSVALTGTGVTINANTGLTGASRACTISVAGIAALCISNLPASEACDNSIVNAPGISQSLGAFAGTYSFATGTSCGGALATITF